VPVSSWKGHLGHSLAACGALEAIGVIASMARGLLAGTRNLEAPDVAPLRLWTGPSERRVQRALSTSFAFGGVNTALVLAANGAA
jgi:3-oxoacyl-[acyl-carrier-protein] synthase II